jgi:putative membrane-bound dehydrogenase-like protein
MYRQLLGSALLALLATTTAHAQFTPEKSLSMFQVSPGLEIKLWASEPLFSNPTCMDVDPLGRVWVCESVNYRDKLHKRPLRRKEGDRILILEDSKGTGKADKVTVFYQAPEILAPLGIAVLKHPSDPGYTVFVCQSPDILVFEDRDGDGKADGPPRKLLTGFRGIDHDHGVHGISIGPDGKLYFSVGDQGVAGLVDKNGKTWTSNETDCRAGTIWRCDQDGKNLELIAHNFRNEYEPCVDSFGSIFVSDNDDDGNQQTRICEVLPGANYGYHPRGPGQTHWHEEEPGVMPKILRTYFGSPTGMCVYEGKLLPEKYRGQLLHTDAGPRHVRCYHLKPEGASYAVDREDMVTTDDPWFRPSDVCVAPDGTLFVSDWYDPGVGGHGMGDITRGRIYRIAPPGISYLVPQADLHSDGGILASLGSPALSVRAMAIARLRELNASQLIEFGKFAVKSKPEPILLARIYWQCAICCLALAEQPVCKPDQKAMLTSASAQIVGACLENEDPRFRMLGVRLLASYIKDQDVTRADFGQRIEPAKDLSPLVRRELLLALRNLPAAKVKDLIMAGAKQYDGKDRVYLESLGIAVGHDKKRREVILADFDKQFPGWSSQIADLVWELRPPQMIARVKQRLANEENNAEERRQLIDIMSGDADPSGGIVLLSALINERHPVIQDRILQALKLGLAGKWRSMQTDFELDRALKTLLERPKTRELGFKLIAAARRTKEAANIGKLIDDTSTPADAHIEGIRTLATLGGGQSVQTLDHIVQSTSPTDRKEALAALGKLAEQQRRNNPNPALTALTRIVIDDHKPAELRIAAAGALSGGRPGSLWLADNLNNQQVPADVKAEATRLLKNSPYQDIRKRVVAMAAPSNRLDPKNVPEPRSLLNRRGDARRGEQLMAASARSDLLCLKCHTVNKQGGQIGPDLSAIGKKASRENLLESILLPSKAVADQYVSWVIETQNGLVLTGLVVEDTADHVLLRDANGKDTRIDKKSIAGRTKSPTSLMPGDLIGAMTNADLVDVVEYLLTLQASEPGKK